MYDEYLFLEFEVNDDGKLLLKNPADGKDRCLYHDETLELKAGDLFDGYKKIFMVFQDAHLHLHYKISLENIDKFEQFHDVQLEMENSIEYKFNSNEISIRNGFLFFIEALAHKIESVIYQAKDLPESFKPEKLVSVMSSDCHGDPISFLIPLRLSHNFRITNIQNNIIQASIAYGSTCIIDGDYYTQSIEYYISYNKSTLMNQSTMKLSLLKDKNILDFVHDLIIKTLWLLIFKTRMQATNVWFLLGNHDSDIFKPMKLETRLKPITSFQSIDTSYFHDGLAILYTLEVKDRVYIIQHGVFNMNIGNVVIKNPLLPPDEELMNIIYDKRKLKFLQSNYCSRLSAISFQQIQPEIKLIDENYIETKIKTWIDKVSRSESHKGYLLNDLAKMKVETVSIKNLYHSRDTYNKALLNKRFKDFLKQLTSLNKIKAFLVIGHSADYGFLSFGTSKKNIKTIEDIPIIQQTNDVFMNIIGLDMQTNSLMNDFMYKKYTQKPSQKKGGTIKSSLKTIILLILFIVCLIICIVSILKRQCEMDFSFMNFHSQWRE